MTNLWLEVKDNDWYSQQLRELSYFKGLLYPAGQTLGQFDAIMRDVYLPSIIENLNRKSVLMDLIPTVIKHQRRRRKWWQRGLLRWTFRC